MLIKVEVWTSYCSKLSKHFMLKSKNMTTGQTTELLLLFNVKVYKLEDKNKCFSGFK